MTIDCLPLPGSSISVYCEDILIEGDVLCVDGPKKLIVLQKPSTLGTTNTCDIFILRAEYLRDMKSLKEVLPLTYPELSTTKILERIKLNEKIQQDKLKLYAHDVPIEARKLAEFLETHFSVSWDKPNIVVMEHTYIGFPYKSGNVSCKSDIKQIKLQTEYVQKLVNRFYKDRPTDNQDSK